MLTKFVQGCSFPERISCVTNFSVWFFCRCQDSLVVGTSPGFNCSDGVPMEDFNIQESSSERGAKLPDGRLFKSTRLTRHPDSETTCFLKGSYYNTRCEYD